MMRQRDDEDWLKEKKDVAAYRNNVTHRQKITKAKKALVDGFVR